MNHLKRPLKRSVRPLVSLCTRQLLPQSSLACNQSSKRANRRPLFVFEVAGSLHHSWRSLPRPQPRLHRAPEAHVPSMGFFLFRHRHLCQCPTGTTHHCVSCDAACAKHCHQVFVHRMKLNGKSNATLQIHLTSSPTTLCDKRTVVMHHVTYSKATQNCQHVFGAQLHDTSNDTHHGHLPHSGPVHNYERSSLSLVRGRFVPRGFFLP